MSEFENNLNIICLESKAFYALIDDVVEHIKQEHNPTQEKWITDTEAMSLLGISSKTTLQKYRDNGDIRYSQIGKKVIMYDRESIMQFLENNAKDTF